MRLVSQMFAIAGTLTKLLSSATTYSDRTAKNLTRSAVTNTSFLISAAQDVALTNAVDYSSSSSYLKQSSVPPIDTYASLSDSKREVVRQLNSVLCGDSSDSEETYDREPLVTFFDKPWLPSHSTKSLRPREVSRGRKQKWVSKHTHEGNRFSKLTRMCTHNLGADAAIDVLGRFGSEIGVKEYNAIIEVCIEKARNTDDEDIALEEFNKAFRFFESMRKLGFEIGEETYDQFLMFIIEKCMVKEFHFFSENIKKEKPTSLSRLAYYEMLLWIKLNDGDKIQMLIANSNNESNFNESYLVALCEGNRQEEVSMLLERLDIKKVSSKESMERVFKSLGRLSLETHAKKILPRTQK